MADLTTVILTYNEEKNIANAINSVKEISKRIVVVDSYSTDNTVEIAKSLGAEIIQHEFVNQAKQFNFALDTLNLQTKWILRLDADEIVTEEAAIEIEDICNKNMETNVNGVIVRFKLIFLEKALKYGGIYPIKVLRIYKTGMVHIEDRNMDEHAIIKNGKIIEMKNDILHCDCKNLFSWVDKHNKYSTREVEDYFINLEKKEKIKITSKSAQMKRFIKYNVYYKLPLGMRAHLYFIFRYYIKLGFLDGKEGKIFAFLQAYWYRFLVDAKIYEKNK